jgi:hypothetical protein
MSKKHVLPVLNGNRGHRQSICHGKVFSLVLVLILFFSTMTVFLETPQVKADSSGTNLPVNLEAWNYDLTGMRGINSPISPCVTYSIYNENPCIKIESGMKDSNPAYQAFDSPSGFFDPEADTAFYSVKAGDQIYFTADVSFTAIDSSRSGSLSYGAIIGFDYYGVDGRIQGIQTPDGSPSVTYTSSGVAVWASNNVHNLVTSGETRQITINATVPSREEYDGFGTIDGSYTPAVGTSEVPTFFTAWLFIYAFSGEQAVANFWNVQLYINPSISSSPSPAPSPTPSSPSPSHAPSPSPSPSLPTSSVTVTSIGLGLTYVESGFVLPVDVTLHNSGSAPEVARVELFANSTSIFNGTLILDSLASGALFCPANTTSLPIGNYTINASVTAQGESNVTPSTMSAGTVGVTYVGDLNGDFKVDANDFFLFLNDYNIYWKTGYVNRGADFNHDGKIDFNDMQTFLNAYINFATQGKSTKNNQQ